METRRRHRFTSVAILLVTFGVCSLLFWQTEIQSLNPATVFQTALEDGALDDTRWEMLQNIEPAVRRLHLAGPSIPLYNFTHDRVFLFDAISGSQGRTIQFLSPVVPNVQEEINHGKKSLTFKTHNKFFGGSFELEFEESVLPRSSCVSRTDRFGLLKRFGMMIVTCKVPAIKQEEWRRSPQGTLPVTLRYLQHAAVDWKEYPMTARLASTAHLPDRYPLPALIPRQVDEKFKRKLGACTMLAPKLLNGEWVDEILDEWIVYHRLAGVQHFFIYLDAHPAVNVTRTWLLLQPYIEAGLVTAVDWPVRYMVDPREPAAEGAWSVWDWVNQDRRVAMWPQVLSSNDCRARFGQDFEWLMVGDVDEFAVSQAVNATAQHMLKVIKKVEKQHAESELGKEKAAAQRAAAKAQSASSSASLASVPYSSTPLCALGVSFQNYLLSPLQAKALRMARKSAEKLLLRQEAGEGAGEEEPSPPPTPPPPPLLSPYKQEQAYELIMNRYHHHEREFAECCKNAGKNIIKPEHVHFVYIHNVACSSQAKQVLVRPLCTTAKPKMCGMFLAHYKGYTGRKFSLGEKYSKSTDAHPIQLYRPGATAGWRAMAAYRRVRGEYEMLPSTAQVGARKKLMNKLRRREKAVEETLDMKIPRFRIWNATNSGRPGHPGRERALYR